MSQNKTIIAQTTDEISKAVQENLKLSKAQATTGDSQDTQTAIPVINLSAPINDSGFATEHAILLSNMLQAGKSDEALAYLNKFTQNAQTKEAEKVALSEISASISTVNDPEQENEQQELKQLEDIKSQKEDIKLSLLNQISKLTDILHTYVPHTSVTKLP